MQNNNNMYYQLNNRNKPRANAKVMWKRGWTSPSKWKYHQMMTKYLENLMYMLMFSITVIYHTYTRWSGMS